MVLQNEISLFVEISDPLAYQLILSCQLRHPTQVTKCFQSQMRLTGKTDQTIRWQRKPIPTPIKVSHYIDA